MNIKRLNQYNQGIGKYKLLSSTSGVGSIVTTKVGSYVLISDINKWKFIRWINSRIETIRSNNSDDKEIYRLAKIDIKQRGLPFVDDERFIKFIKREKNIGNLICLVGIPHMALDDNFNTPKWIKKINNQIFPSHPIAVALDKAGEDYRFAYPQYQIQGTLFPKWFKNKKGALRKIDEWSRLWSNECLRQNGTVTKDNFAPPRDAGDCLWTTETTNKDGVKVTFKEYRILEQTNLVLICPNGHLSDIPWPNYLRWKTEKYLRQRPEEDKGENLMSNELVGPCCGNPNLKWTESTTKSEGYGSIYIECLSCGLGAEKGAGKPKINLEGINSIEPYCPGQKPWELDIEKPSGIPYENCLVGGEVRNGREKMKVALVTANNVYYANGFSSLFIPMHLAENKSKELLLAISVLEKKYQKHFERTAITREEFWKTKFNLEDFLDDNDLNIDNKVAFEDQLRLEFLSASTEISNIDEHENYRWQEYRCFANNSSLPDIDANKGIRFRDIILPVELSDYFKKIQQVEELKVTNVQLDFTRVKPKERIVLGGIVKESSGGKNIFSIDSKELFALPANETLGEGLFFEFSNDFIDTWIAENFQILDQRFANYFHQLPDQKSQGLGSKMKLYNNQYKQFLIHSFSHLMMRELEFSCGYPTASLKERLYISRNSERPMSGVLIYTAEGSEGSMGGLVSQGEPDKIMEIIKKGLERSINCSSDPLCWESEGQGIFDLNLSACFSCSLVAETACEEMNLGLDRRILVDQGFGYFKELITG